MSTFQIHEKQHHAVFALIIISLTGKRIKVNRHVLFSLSCKSKVWDTKQSSPKPSTASTALESWPGRSGHFTMARKSGKRKPPNRCPDSPNFRGFFDTSIMTRISTQSNPELSGTSANMKAGDGDDSPNAKSAFLWSSFTRTYLETAGYLQN